MILRYASAIGCKNVDRLRLKYSYSVTVKHLHTASTIQYPLVTAFLKSG